MSPLEAPLEACLPGERYHEQMVAARQTCMDGQKLNGLTILHSYTPRTLEADNFELMACKE